MEGFVSQNGYSLAVGWERAFKLTGQSLPAEPKARNEGAYRRFLLEKLPHDSEAERSILSEAMKRWAARTHGSGGVSAFVEHELKSQDEAERERKYRAKHGLQEGPLVPILSQREIDAGITMPTEE